MLGEVSGGALFRPVHTGLFVLMAVLWLPAVQAHHSFGLYADEAIEIEGRIVEVSWRNPHVRFSMEVAGENVPPQIWTLEGGASYVLNRRGISQDMFQPGTTLLVAGRPHMRDASLMLLTNMLLENGYEVLMAGGVEPRWSGDTLGQDGNNQPADTAGLDSGLFRVWSRAVLLPITYGENLPYRDAAMPGGPEWIERLNQYARGCEPTGMPGVMATPYPFEFIDKGDRIEVYGFSNNAPFSRTIYMTDSGRPDSGSHAARFGLSRGRWQSENLLIIETRDIDWPYFDDTTGTPLGEEALVTEYLQMDADQTSLDYRMVVSDASLFDTPVPVIDTRWAALGEELVFPQECSN